jgi:hypothetical protein
VEKTTNHPVRTMLSDAQRRFIHTHRPCEISRCEKDAVLVYCYDAMILTRYSIARDGEIIGAQSFLATAADRRVAVALGCA